MTMGMEVATRVAIRQETLPRRPSNLSVVVHIDWLESVDLPDWGAKFLNPEYRFVENRSPSSFDVERVERWSLPEVNAGSDKLADVWNTLNQKGLIENCFGFYELEAIEGKGTDFFSRHFINERIYGWRSACQSKKREGVNYVPFVYEINWAMAIGWAPFGRACQVRDTTLLHPFVKS